MSHRISHTFKISEIASFISFFFTLLFVLFFLLSSWRFSSDVEKDSCPKTSKRIYVFPNSESFKFLKRMCGNVLWTAADGLFHIKEKQKKKKIHRPTVERDIREYKKNLTNAVKPQIPPIH